MKYKISIVMPFYNSESYIEEAIESVINQTIGFENIQLILVNDGSNDNSEKICLKYKNIYNNIIYIKQENGGVSSARNKGLEYVEGKYTNFIDSDDKWDKNALLKLYNFMEENYLEVDFASARIKNFEANEDYHYLDYKFYNTRVIDIMEEPEMIIFHVASTLFKTEIVKNMRFDTKIKIGEDAVFTNIILLNKLKYGVVREAIYNYRKRNTNNSTMQSIFRNKTWYFDSPRYFWKRLIDESIKIHKKVIDYIQFVLLYEIRWRINCDYIGFNFLEVKEHLKLVEDTVKYIDYKNIEKYCFLTDDEKSIIKQIKDI